MYLLKIGAIEQVTEYNGFFSNILQANREVQTWSKLYNKLFQLSAADKVERFSHGHEPRDSLFAQVVNFKKTLVTEF